jgi:hypothetical protein
MTQQDDVRAGRPMKVGIALDDWKLPVFRKRLRAAGYKYRDGGEATLGVTLLTVETNDMLKLKTVLEECKAECRKMWRNH